MLRWPPLLRVQLPSIQLADLPRTLSERDGGVRYFCGYQGTLKRLESDHVLHFSAPLLAAKGLVAREERLRQENSLLLFLLSHA